MKKSSRPSGPSQRQLRVGEAIRREVTDMLLRGEIFDPDLTGASVTVTEGRASSDLRQVTLYVSALGGNGEERVLAALRRHSKYIKRETLNGMSMRFTPDIRFELDPTFDQMDASKRMFSDPKVRQDLDD